MKAVLLLAGLITLISTSSYAHADEEVYQPQCLDQAKQAVAKKFKVKLSSVSLHTSALIGDGVDALETIALQVKGMGGLVVINMEYDDCSIFFGPKPLNN